MDKKEFKKQVDDLKVEIKSIQEGVFKLRTTGIRENLIYSMIQKASDNVGGRCHSQPIPIATIKAIMEGIEGLYEYVFPEVE